MQKVKFTIMPNQTWESKTSANGRTYVQSDVLHQILNDDGSMQEAAVIRLYNDDPLPTGNYERVPAGYTLDGGKFKKLIVSAFEFVAVK